MCECFQIGGPFIAEDPDCPEHGRAAQRRSLKREQLLERIQQELGTCYPPSENQFRRTSMLLLDLRDFLWEV